MRLSLGTAQFGLDYGLFNKTGKLSQVEIERVLNFCIKVGINKIDTANSYGNSIPAIQNFDLSSYFITNKINISDEHLSCNNLLMSQIGKQKKFFNTSKEYNLLIHNPGFLDNKEKQTKALDQLIKCKSEGLIDKIGISIYSPSDLDNFFCLEAIDIVQTPFNLFDIRIKSSGWLDILKMNNIKVQARSIFLQGLILCPIDDIPLNFLKFINQFTHLDNVCTNMQLSRLELALYFVLSFEEFDDIVVGIDSMEQLIKIVQIADTKRDIFQSDLINDFMYLNSLDGHDLLIDPRRW